MPQFSITDKAKSLLRRINGTSALLTEFASSKTQLKELISQNATDLNAMRADNNCTAQEILDQIKQLDEKLDQIVAEQAKVNNKLDRVLHRQNSIIKPSHDIRSHLAFQEIKANGFWFVDIPRTSSTSIRVELGQQYGPAYAKANVNE